jgi:uncharacterized protein (TIGR02646 family)
VLAMISVARIPPPKALHKNADRWLLKLQEITGNANSTKQQIENAKNKYRHDQVKNALVKMFNENCAYCESKITVVTYGAIEHFRPKSTYPDLTFTWENLMLSCDLCNNAKGVQFPLDSQGHPLLIDPTDPVTKPSQHLKFSWDVVTGLASVYGSDQQGKTVENIFDLNCVHGRTGLIEHRSKYVKRLLVLLHFAQSGNQEAISVLQEASEPGAEYSAFAITHILPYLIQTKDVAKY